MENETNDAELAHYPTTLADLLAVAMTLWDEAGTQDPGEPEADPSLEEAVANNWSLAEFLALYVQRQGFSLVKSMEAHAIVSWLTAPPQGPASVAEAARLGESLRSQVGALDV